MTDATELARAVLTALVRSGVRELVLTPGSRNAPLAFAMEPPGYQLHVWTEGVGLVTHTAVIGSFDGPYPFREPRGKLIE